MSTITRMTRQELYDRVWAKPATKVAAELGISDVGLIKLCQRHDIPKPPAGHWSKVAMGKWFERPPLPPAASPELEIVTLDPATTPGMASSRKPEAFPSIPVPKQLMAPHPLVATTLAMLESGKRDRNGLVDAGGPKAMSIAVTPKNIGRAVRIMDTFLKAMEAQGFVFQPRRADEQAGMVARKGALDYRLKLREHVQRTELTLTPKQMEEIKKWGHCFGDRYKYTPGGRLVFTFGEDFEAIICQDTANTRVEDKLGHFVGRILQRVARDEERARQRAEEAAARERALAEQRRLEAEAARLRQEEQDRIAAIKDTIARWRLCRDIRDYLREMQELIASYDAQVSKGGPVDQWLRWADSYATQIDPFTPLKRDLEAVMRNRPKANPGAT